MPRVCLRRSQTKAKRCLFTQLDVVEANLGEKGCVLRDDTSKGTDSKLYVYISPCVRVSEKERERESLWFRGWPWPWWIDQRVKPGSRHDYEGSSTSVARIPPEFHASPSSSLGLDLRGHVLLSSIRWLGEGTKGSRDAEWPNRGGWTIAVARENDFQAFLSEPSLSFSANPFRSGTFFLSFLFFSRLREKDFSFFSFLFFSSISFWFLFGFPGKSWKFCAREMIYLFLLILLIR